MIESFDTTLPAITGKKKRKVWVYIPEEAAESDTRYPVLYMMDGHNLFYDDVATYGKCWGLKEYMDETHTPMIIVGVDCNHGKNHGRLSEYSPFTFSDPSFGRVYGRGKLFMEWLTGTLKPFIDAEYPTLPERENTFLAGSSMGGLMTLYGLTAFNGYFSRGAALSPSVWVGPKRLWRMFREAEIAPDTVLYMDYGSEEMGNHDDMRTGFAQTAAVLMGRGIHVTARIVPGGTHCEASWEKQIPFFMNTLLYEG